MLNCKDAIFLMSKRDEGKLSMIDRMRLSLHISMCHLCRKFEKQITKIGLGTKNVHSDFQLPVDVKSKLKKVLDEMGNSLVENF